MTAGVVHDRPLYDGEGDTGCTFTSMHTSHTWLVEPMGGIAYSVTCPGRELCRAPAGTYDGAGGRPACLVPCLHASEYSAKGRADSSLESFHDEGSICFQHALHRHDPKGYIVWQGHRRKVTETGGAKDNIGKPRWDLLPMRAVGNMAEVLGYGAVKYAPGNWRLGLAWSDMMASAMRHLAAFQDGEEIDPETGLSHLAHAMCQVGFLEESRVSGYGQDDRFTSVSRETAKAPE